MTRTCLVLALGLAATLDAGQQTFRTSTDVVMLPVTVTGRGNTLIRGLKLEDFEVLEDGKRQTLTFFSEGASGSAVPLHLGLLLDTSSSMDKDLATAASAAIKFVNALEEAVDVTFVDFSTEVRVSRFSPASYAHLFERVREHKAEGSTALYDALAMYLSAAAEQDGQKVLLLYTDGEDSTSTTSYGKVVEMLRLSNVMVYAIGYLENLGSSRATAQVRLNEVSHQTGGEAFYPLGRKNLDEIYARILDELGARYTLGFISTNPLPNGKWRKLEVRSTAPGAKGAKVRTRPGYFAPLR
ncbi:MAG: VWA domain-containing protein [Vicinamibacterales bacterium]